MVITSTAARDFTSLLRYSRFGTHQERREYVTTLRHSRFCSYIMKHHPFQPHSLCCKSSSEARCSYEHSFGFHEHCAHWGVFWCLVMIHTSSVLIDSENGYVVKIQPMHSAPWSIITNTLNLRFQATHKIRRLQCWLHYTLFTQQLVFIIGRYMQKSNLHA